MKWIATSIVCLSFVAMWGCGRAEKANLKQSRLSAPVSLAGMWELDDSHEREHYVILSNDGTGLQSTSGIRNQSGTWERMQDKGYVYWSDGWTDVISQENGKMQLASYAPGSSLEGEPTTRSTLKQVYPGAPKPREAGLAKSKTTWSHRLMETNCCSEKAK